MPFKSTSKKFSNTILMNILCKNSSETKIFSKDTNILL